MAERARWTAAAVLVALGAVGCGREGGSSGGGGTPAYAVADDEPDGGTIPVPGAPAAAPGAARAPGAPKYDPDATYLGMGTDPRRGPPGLVQPPGWNQVEFEPAEMSFGVQPPGAKVAGTSRLWNVGTTGLVIKEARTSCGCTATEDLAGRPIPPAGYIDFSTTMSLKSGTGPKKEKITIFFVGDKVAVQYYTAEVSLAVRVSPPYLQASEFNEGRWTNYPTGEVTLSSLDGQPFRVLASHGAEPDFVDYDPDLDPPRSEYAVRWDVRRFGGQIPWFWVFETDHPGAPLVDVRIRHVTTQVTSQKGRAWVAKDQRVLAGEIRAGEPFDVTTKVEYAGNVTPSPDAFFVRTRSQKMEVEVTDAQQDDQFVNLQLHVAPAADAEPGLFYENLTIHDGTLTAPLTVIARVEE